MKQKFIVVAAVTIIVGSLFFQGVVFGKKTEIYSFGNRINTLFAGVFAQGDQDKKLPEIIINESSLDGFSQADINLYLGDNKINNRQPVYVCKNRFYISLQETISLLGGKVSVNNSDARIDIEKASINIDLKDKKFSTNDKENISFLKPIYSKDESIYISLIDFCKMVDFRTKWSLENNAISFLRQNNIDSPQYKNNSMGKPALIRLEDVAPNPAQNPDELEKLRVIADYLHSADIPFSVAWIPRYVNPGKEIDNDPSRQYSLYNADFVFTLDYLIQSNGSIGLHGYTHQYKESVSAEGNEFHAINNEINVTDTTEYAQERVNLSKDAAYRLEIPISFFEVPHYVATPEQFEVFEKNFDTLYEPYFQNSVRDRNAKVHVIEKGNTNVVYIPTPLYYVNGKINFDNMIKRINSLDSSYLASFFFHPFLDYEFIDLRTNLDGSTAYSYSSQSMLHLMINELLKKGYSFVNVGEVKNVNIAQYNLKKYKTTF